MNSQLDEQHWFETILALTGREVEVGLLSAGAALTGRLANAMFDSFILEERGVPRVIRFSDINYLLPKAAPRLNPDRSNSGGSSAG